MKRGLVIGKFLPIHKGHIALINFAAEQCDELIVSMSYTLQDVIDPVLRFEWIKEIFQSNQKIKPFMIPDDFDREDLPLSERTKVWAEVIKKTYPAIDVVYTSEEYGVSFASNLKAVHVVFDAARKIVPVSATLIRNKPFRYWSFIPEVVRPYFVKKICFYGAESTGKSTAAQKFAVKYHTELVPEVAREMITSNDFSVDDIIRIGLAHYDRIQTKLKTADKFLFCDTDAITTQVYSDFYLKVIPPVLFELEQKVKYDHYFLFDVDVPWVADGLRDLGSQREDMFHVFKNALDQRKISYTLVSGSWEQRENTIEQKLREISSRYE